MSYPAIATAYEVYEDIAPGAVLHGTCTTVKYVDKNTRSVLSLPEVGALIGLRTGMAARWLERSIARRDLTHV